MLTISQQKYYTFLFQTLKINIIKNNYDISLERENICISPKVSRLVVPSFGSSVMSWKQYELPQPEGPGLLSWGILGNQPQWAVVRIKWDYISERNLHGVWHMLVNVSSFPSTLLCRDKKYRRWTSPRVGGRNRELLSQLSCSLGCGRNSLPVFLFFLLVVDAPPPWFLIGTQEPGSTIS